MEAEGLKLAVLYSYGCQQIKKMKAGRHLLSFFRKENPNIKECKIIIKILKNLLSYEGYCQIRCLKVQENLFNPNVVRAYWLGDTKLEIGSLNHNFATLEKFKSIKTIEHLPDDIIERMLDCATSFGKVTEVFSDEVEVFNRRLLYKDGKVVFGKQKRQISNIFGIEFKTGDLTSIHSGIAGEKISKNQAKDLKDITLKALRTLEMA